MTAITSVSRHFACVGCAALLASCGFGVGDPPLSLTEDIVVRYPHSVRSTEALEHDWYSAGDIDSDFIMLLSADGRQRHEQRLGGRAIVHHQCNADLGAAPVGCGGPQTASKHRPDPCLRYRFPPGVIRSRAQNRA